MVANETWDSTLSGYVIIPGRQISKIVIFTQLCKIQKCFVKNPKASDLASFQCMSHKIVHDDAYQNIPNESVADPGGGGPGGPDPPFWATM